MTSLQILVVEDNQTQSQLVSFLLEENGYTVQAAHSAEEALEALRSFSPDLILMDLQLPGMDGLQLVRELRCNPAFGTTPIIAMTAYTDPSDLERAREAGCSGKISKPIDTATFARLISKFVNSNTEIPADVPCDSTDLLAEVRNTFLAEGLEQSNTILKGLHEDPSCSVEVMQRLIHRWAGMGVVLGFPEISNLAREIEVLFGQASPHVEELEKKFHSAHRSFGLAARTKPRLPLELIRGLFGARIGLMDFSPEEANRLRKAAEDGHIRLLIEQFKDGNSEALLQYSALVVNECAISSEAAWHRPQLPLPAIFIRSRSSLQSLARLPARACDFVIAPWEGEEVLIRLYRLIGNAAGLQQAAGASYGKGTRPRVLIADDDPSIVALVSETLQQFQMDCDIARSGSQALEAVRRGLPDAIVLDINMLDMDGFEVLRRLRRNLITAEIPVLLLTARNEESDIGQGLGSGANDYVVKPFQPMDLAKRVDKLVCARRGQACAAGDPAISNRT